MKNWKFKKEFLDRQAGIRLKLNGMLQRCHNADNPGYTYYGAKGITVCDEWVHNPDSFVVWALNNDYFKHSHIHRLNTHRGYSPDNCIFVTPVIHRKLHAQIVADNIKFSLEGRSITIDRVEQEARNVVEEYTVLSDLLYLKTL